MGIREIHHCSVCGTCCQVQLHHVAFRSQAPLLKNIRLNFKYLCNEHHQGKNGPHKNRYVDLTYKLELQDKLFELFNKDFYTEKEIQELLNTTSSTARKICKKLRLYKGGYSSKELVKRLMGDRIYTTEELKEFEYENPKLKGAV